LQASKAQQAIELCDSYLDLHGTEDCLEMDWLRDKKSLALSQLGRHEEALAQLSFVQISNYVLNLHWKSLSDAQLKVGQLSEAIKSMEKAVELTRTHDHILTYKNPKPLARMCERLAILYQQGGQLQDARRLAQEAKSLS
jgi:tetratricopeptide (TPR) repeat protein